MKPLAIDLFCGLGGWTEGLLAEGYDVIGFDIERHQYGEHRYPGKFAGRWMAQIKVDLRAVYGGLFDDPETAARAYDVMARKYHGEFARMNFPNE